MAKKKVSGTAAVVRLVIVSLRMDCKALAEFFRERSRRDPPPDSPVLPELAFCNEGMGELVAALWQDSPAVDNVCELLGVVAEEAGRFTPTGTREVYPANGQIGPRINDAGDIVRLVISAARRDWGAVKDFFQARLSPQTGDGFLPDQVLADLSLCEGVDDLLDALSQESPDLDEVCRLLEVVAADAQHLYNQFSHPELGDLDVPRGVDPGVILEIASMNGDGRDDIDMGPGTEPTGPFSDVVLIRDDAGGEGNGAEVVDVTAMDPRLSGINLGRPSDSGIDLQTANPADFCPAEEDGDLTGVGSDGSGDDLNSSGDDPQGRFHHLSWGDICGGSPEERPSDQLAPINSRVGPGTFWHSTVASPPLPEGKAGDSRESTPILGLSVTTTGPTPAGSALPPDDAILANPELVPLGADELPGDFPSSGEAVGHGEHDVPPDIFRSPPEQQGGGEPGGEK